MLGTRAACRAGRPASPGICSPAPLPGRARPHMGLSVAVPLAQIRTDGSGGRLRGCGPARMPWACQPRCVLCGRVGCTPASENSGHSWRSVGRTRCGHLCLWLSDLCARGPLHTHRRRGDVGACGWMWGEACAQPAPARPCTSSASASVKKTRSVPLSEEGTGAAAGLRRQGLLPGNSREGLLLRPLQAGVHTGKCPPKWETGVTPKKGSVANHELGHSAGR